MPANGSHFIPIETHCPKCGLREVSLLKKMLICEHCGWYFIYNTIEESKNLIVRIEKEIIKPKLKPMSEFMLNDSNDRDK
jgi:hypothetical protein